MLAEAHAAHDKKGLGPCGPRTAFASVLGAGNSETGVSASQRAPCDGHFGAGDAGCEEAKSAAGSTFTIVQLATITAKAGKDPASCL
jgi:hypothetical protein